MATNYKVLGQLAPSAATDTDAYTVPVSTQTIISSLVITERGGAAASFRIAVRVGGAALSSSQYIAYDSPIAANDLVALTLGIALSAGDVVTVYASSADLSFNLFGSEVS